MQVPPQLVPSLSWKLSHPGARLKRHSLQYLQGMVGAIRRGTCRAQGRTKRRRLTLPLHHDIPHTGAWWGQVPLHAWVALPAS
jgi:hypothetical protein